MISDQTKNADNESGADCDLAVAVRPDVKTLKAAWAALKPGGMLYTEWQAPIGRVRRALQLAGFRDVQCYWSWPLSDRLPLFWVPLNSRGARSAWLYLLTSRPPDRHRLRHWTRWLLRGTAYAIQRAGWLMPVYALAHKPDTISGTTLIDWLRARWSDWQLGSLPQDLSLLFLTGGKHSTNKIVALVFAEAETQPRLVMKMPRVAESNAGLQREAVMLQVLQARRKTIMPGVPQIVFYEECDTHCLLGETALGGVPLFTLLNRHNYRAWALKATDWLIELAGAPAPVSRDGWWSRVIESVLDDFQRSFGAALDQHMIRETYAMLAKLDSLPLVCEQRDFSPWNVFATTDGELVVLDWESAELDGLPGLDLIYFLTYLAFFSKGAMDSGAFVEAYRGCWSELTLIGQVNAECLRRYCEALNLDYALAPALRLFTWLLHSRSEYARLMTDAGDRPSDETLQHSLFVQLWGEEVRRANVNNGQPT
jgi:hypothetical protein